MKAVDKIARKELQKMAKKMRDNLVKADVDMGMHSDGEAYLLESGSKQNDLWGVNLYPDDYGTDDFIEFDSMINVRPSHGNPSKNILDSKIRDIIVQLVNEVVHE